MGLVVVSALAVPNILQILKPQDRHKRHRFKKTIKKLFDDKIIYLSGEEVKLSERGLELLKLSQVEEIYLDKGDIKWDGLWHLVCYDIPEPLKDKRDCFRRKLIELGFYQVQYSLWVIPWGCKEEIAIIAQNLGIAPFVAYLNTDYLPQQEKLVCCFDLES